MNERITKTELFASLANKRSGAGSDLQAIAQQAFEQGRIKGEPAPETSCARRPRGHVEDDEQATVIHWARLMGQKHPALRWLLHIPNGGSRNPQEAARLKAQGVLPGVADLFLPVARRDFHGCWLEMKTEEGRVSPEQKAFLADMTAAGYFAQVVRGSEEAIRTLQWYLEVN